LRTRYLLPIDESGFAGGSGSMSAEELQEFLAAMELVRQANMAFSDIVCNFVENDDLDLEQDDLDEDCGIAGSCKSPTIH
jgi:hypothetical protein